MKSRLSVTAILFFTLIISSSAQEQEPSALEKIRQKQALLGGTLQGKVRDESTGEDLIGANVFLVNTTLGASTDIDGKYQIKRIPDGIYDVRISFLGYETKVITGVEVKTGDLKILDVSLSEDQGLQQQEVVISASAIKSGEGAILAERKKSASIGDGISSEQMKKAPDATSGDALKRVTGVSIVDNKFVFVRGVTDRYNQTTLNGASVTSTSVDKKSFSFDMLPSNLLENMNVAKTATPDLPGDFTGGLVQLNTLDFPESRSVKFVYAGSYNSITTFESFQRSQSGGSDWLGSDDGIRSFPEGTTASAPLHQRLPNTWGAVAQRAPMNQSMSVSVGDNFYFDEHQLGVIAALSYRNNFSHQELTIHDVSGQSTQRKLTGVSDKYSVLWGTILDLNVKYADLHKFSFKNNYNRSAEDKINESGGLDIYNDNRTRSYQIEWEQRSMYSGQLGGEHRFPEVMHLNVDWLGYFSQAYTDQPDRKQIAYTLPLAANTDTDPFIASPGERSWSNLYDKTSGQKMNLVLPMGNMKFKSGVLNERKYRDYSIRYFQVDHSSLAPQHFYYTVLPVQEIYQAEHFGPGKFGMTEISKPSDKYAAEHTLFAYYLMADVPFSIGSLEFRATGGVRMEHSIQKVFTQQSRTSSLPFVSSIANRDFLPSLNFTYMINEAQNLRFAYSKTVNRPEFREMASVYSYDFDKYEYVYGNTSLQRATVNNYDIRYEIFPEIGDLMAVSYFYKEMFSPIEEVRTFSSFAERTWFNAEKGKNHGWEFELRKNFRFLGEYFGNFQLIGNYTRIYSEVPYSVDLGGSGNPMIVTGTRAMQGQSPYMYNLSLFFNEPHYGTSVNVLYNEFGSRIDAITDLRSGDGNIYEHKRGTVDASVTQPLQSLLHGLESKFTVKNLNNQDVVYTQDGNDQRRINVGINYSLQFNYQF